MLILRSCNNNSGEKVGGKISGGGCGTEGGFRVRVRVTLQYVFINSYGIFSLY